VAWAGASGNFELNVMLPVIARNVLESIRLLSTSSTLLAERCVDGITANAERMQAYAASSPSVVTPLNRYIGYENAAKVAKRALADGATIRETVIAMGFVERGELTEEQLDEARPQPLLVVDLLPELRAQVVVLGAEHVLVLVDPTSPVVQCGGPADDVIGFPLVARGHVGVEERVGVALDLQVDPPELRVAARTDGRHRPP
jgi:hypothetical protein